MQSAALAAAKEIAPRASYSNDVSRVPISARD